MSDQLTEWPKENDLKLWLSRNTKKQAIEKYSLQVGGVITSRQMSNAARGTCKWWLKQKRRRRSRSKAFNEQQWTRLDNAVRRNEDLLAGCNVFQATQILCSLGVQCNERLLRWCLYWRRLARGGHVDMDIN